MFYLQKRKLAIKPLNVIFVIITIMYVNWSNILTIILTQINVIINSVIVNLTLTYYVIVTKTKMLKRHVNYMSK